MKDIKSDIDSIYKDLEKVLGSEAITKLKETSKRDERAKKMKLVEKMKEKAKEKVFTLDNLYKTCFYTFNFTDGGETIYRLAEKHSVKLLDLGSNVTRAGDFTPDVNFQLCIVDGVYFYGSVKRDPVESMTYTKLYVPIWQRDKAKMVLNKFITDNFTYGNILANRGIGSGFSAWQNEKIDEKVRTQQQFIRDEDYNHFDGIFNRMVNNKAYYTDLGKDYKESILLHGAPGTGKTNLIKHLIVKYQLNAWSCTPEQFCSSFGMIKDIKDKSAGKPIVVLLEDIDACDELVLEEYKKAKLDVKTGDFNYSTFINRLDGGGELDNMIVVMTTNYRERIIPSVVRQGRVDHTRELMLLNSQEIAGFVNTDLSEHIASFPDKTFYISNILDLRACTTKEEIDELAKWLAN